MDVNFQDESLLENSRPTAMVFDNNCKILGTIIIPESCNTKGKLIQLVDEHFPHYGLIQIVDGCLIAPSDSIIPLAD